MKNGHFNHNRLESGGEDKIWIKIYKILLSSGNGREPRRRSISHWVKIYGFAGKTSHWMLVEYAF